MLQLFKRKAMYKLNHRSYGLWVGQFIDAIMAVVRTDTDSLGSLTVKHQTGENTRDLDKVEARDAFVSRQDICMAAVSPHNTLNELYVFTRYKTYMKGSMFLRDLFK